MNCELCFAPMIVERQILKLKTLSSSLLLFVMTLLWAFIVSMSYRTVTLSTPSTERGSRSSRLLATNIGAPITSMLRETRIMSCMLIFDLFITFVGNKAMRRVHRSAKKLFYSANCFKAVNVSTKLNQIVFRKHLNFVLDKAQKFIHSRGRPSESDFSSRALGDVITSSWGTVPCFSIISSS